ncbi:MAG: phosphate ABC transporter permease subunit PstC [Peptoniphilus sp.]|nr:phosphate ABC transporter permease subunit PstC [Peptoniphilus sp.]MDD7363702.1 phosphate ABC transporter permease subunit PstC [Bacillota bacterium]MDY6044087.1 phosphate ABC transporter permease subunit PstC [Peptoniphilus sp.]
MHSKRFEKIWEIIFLACSLISVCSIIVMCYFIFKNGVPFMVKTGVAKFILGSEWRPTASPASFGILPMIAGSVYVTIGSIIVGVPIGVLTAIFMAFYCPDSIYRFLKPAVNLMAGIPSIIYGFFGLMIFVPIVRSWWGGTGMTVFTASILLGIMILPTVIGLSESSLRSVPTSYYQGSIALGATHERSLFRVVVPAAKSGILSAIILGIGRSIGETMAVIMIAGNQPMIPRSIKEGTRTMTANIVLEMAYAMGDHREALIATGVVLFIFILIINLAFNLVKRRMK